MAVSTTVLKCLQVNCEPDCHAIEQVGNICLLQILNRIEPNYLAISHFTCLEARIFFLRVLVLVSPHNERLRDINFQVWTKLLCFYYFIHPLQQPGDAGGKLLVLQLGLKCNQVKYMRQTHQQTLLNPFLLEHQCYCVPGNHMESH